MTDISPGFWSLIQRTPRIKYLCTHLFILDVAKPREVDVPSGHTVLSRVPYCPFTQLHYVILSPITSSAPTEKGNGEGDHSDPNVSSLDCLVVIKIMSGVIWRESAIHPPKEQRDQLCSLGICLLENRTHKELNTFY